MVIIEEISSGGWHSVPGEGYSQSPEPPFLCEKLLMNPYVTLEKEMDFLEILLFKWQNL